MQAIVLAAGRGERLRPLTETRPKVMLPVANKPIIAHVVEKLREAGIDEIALVVGYEKETIKRYFKDSVSYCYQKSAIGTGNAVYVARNFVSDDRFLVINGDLFFTSSLKDFVKSKELSIASYRVQDTSPFGKLKIEGGDIVKLEEKVPGYGFINAGIYLFDTRIFDALKEIVPSPRGEYELTDAIQLLINKKVRFKPYFLDGFWKDIGYPWDLLEVNEFVLKSIGKSIVGKDCRISKSATIVDPCIIGDDCELRNCVVRPYSSIGDNCVIGNFTIVKNSIIMKNTKIPHHNYVGDSIIGENCNLGAGTKIANLRFDGKTVKVSIKGKKVDSKRRKLGAIIGDNVKTAINVSIYPGIKIGPNCEIGAETVVANDVEKNTRIWVEQKILKKVLK
jgi:bifunctional UDP-N-acetylglucosamine pyrophosphorylase/glucosamine-1-phosphate N-acetyltransferase